MGRTIQLDNEMKRGREQQKRGFRIQLLILLILMLIPFFNIFQEAGTSAFRWQEDRLVLNYPDNSTAEMLYQDVTNIAYRETFDFGAPVTGSTASKYKFGLWNNQEFGDYQVCCHTDIGSCIVLDTLDTHYVISFESAQTTETLYESVRSMLVEKGYLSE